MTQVSETAFVQIFERPHQSSLNGFQACVVHNLWIFVTIAQWRFWMPLPNHCAMMTLLDGDQEPKIVNY